MDKKNALKTIIGELKESQLRITEPRKAILQALIDNHGPFTAEQIFKKFTKKVCDLATVYRSLSSLEEVGVVRRCEFGDGTARYELAEKNQAHHHHHVICTECKKVVVLDDCELDEIDRFAQKRGFSKVHHSLEFFGICSTCK